MKITAGFVKKDLESVVVKEEKPNQGQCEKVEVCKFWHFSVWVIGWLDLILGMIGLCAISALAMLLAQGVIKPEGIDFEVKVTEKHTALYTFQLPLLWLINILAIPFCALHIWKAFKLVRATELERNARKAYNLVKSWLITSSVFFILTVATQLVLWGKVIFTLELSLLFFILFRGVNIVIVFMFLSELAAFKDPRSNDVFTL